MTKDIARVIQAFKDRKSAHGKNCSTDGNTIYSYQMVIARWKDCADTHVQVIGERQSPSKTTTTHIRAVKDSFRYYDEVAGL